MVDVGILFLGLAFVAVPLVLVLKMAWSVFFEGRKQRKWKLAYGVIEESVVEPEMSDRLAYAAIRYKFFIASQPYWAEKCRESGSQQEVEKVIARFPAGKRVAVYYDECDPDEFSFVAELDDNVDELLRPLKFWQAFLIVGLTVLALSPFWALGAYLLYWALNPNPEWSPDAIGLFKN